MRMWDEPSSVDATIMVHDQDSSSLAAMWWREPGARIIEVSSQGEVAVVMGAHPGEDPDSNLGCQSHLKTSPTTTAADWSDQIFLGRVDQAPYFAQVVAGGDLMPLRQFLLHADRVDTELAIRAVALARYHGDHGYCSRCGSPTRLAEWGRSRYCSQCDVIHFPRIDPAVIVAVTDERHRLLLGHHSGWPQSRYSIFAGFTEAGESLEQTVYRELVEEVGLMPQDVRYFGSQPWPFPRSLMVGFTARVTGQPPRPDGEEITAAQWFARSELNAAVESGDVVLPPVDSIAHQLISRWFQTSV